MLSATATAGRDWRSAGLRYFSLRHYLQARFGRPVWKVSLDGKFTCPNRDGTVTTGGCVFCDPTSFSPSRRLKIRSIRQQLDAGIERLTRRHCLDQPGREAAFIAYFQPATNTYAPVERLRQLYLEALEHPQVVGLCIGTRPDCVPEPVLELLAELAGRTWLTVEYGLQSIHDRSLEWINRGHGYAVFPDAMARTRARGIDAGVHVILGLPGESGDDIRATARELARFDLHSIKFHNLYAVRHTKLAEMVTAGQVVLPQREQYVGWVVDFLELLSPTVVVDRLSGDSPPEFLVGPPWCLDKAGLQRAIAAEFQRRDTWQGRWWGNAEC